MVGGPKGRVPKISCFFTFSAEKFVLSSLSVGLLVGSWPRFEAAAHPRFGFSGPQRPPGFHHPAGKSKSRQLSPARQWSNAWLCLLVSAKTVLPVPTSSLHPFPNAARCSWPSRCSGLGLGVYIGLYVFSASNYRGIHLTAQLSKVAERLLLPLVEPHISRFWTKPVRRHQRPWERRKHRPTSRCRGSLRSIAVFCSDVSGVFDRVRAERLLEKLRSKGVHPTLVALAGSWLQQRTAQVVVVPRCPSKTWFSRASCWVPPFGTSSTRMPERALHDAGVVEIVNADDLNCVSRSLNTMLASTPLWPRPRSAHPSSTIGVERTRLRSTPRRSPCRSCPMPSRARRPF